MEGSDHGENTSTCQVLHVIIWFPAFNEKYLRTVEYSEQLATSSAIAFFFHLNYNYFFLWPMSDKGNL